MTDHGSMMIGSNLGTLMPDEGEMIFIGSVESEEKFFRRYRPRE
jgi:hypothetical protein